jgi:hypothetical protein
MAINWVHTFKDEQNLNLHAIDISYGNLANRNGMPAYADRREKRQPILQRHLAIAF